MSNYSGQLKANREWKVLVIDFDPTCLRILEKMLRTCSYHVMACQKAEEAVRLLKEENDFDMIMVDIYMPEMDGMEFIKHICKQRDLPVIAMSSHDDEEIIKEGFKAGACDYLIKPIRLENVKHVWMNVYRHGLMKREQSWSSSVTMINESDSLDYHKNSDNNKSTSDVEDSKCVKRRKLSNNNNQLQIDYASTAIKKQRVIWTPELHHKFVAAVTQFGNSKAVPKKILELMNVPGLTRENVASHLQKYRQYQKRVEQSSDQQSGRIMNLMSSKEECFQRRSPITGHNIQAQVIATSSLQFRGYPSQNDLYGRKYANVNDVVDHQMLSFRQTQPHQNIGQIANAADINLAIVKHVEGSNVIYHPLASYAYSKIDSKIHVVENPYNWSTFSMEDNPKKEVAPFSAREMTTSIGAQQCVNYAYENGFDLGYNDASLYIEHLDQNAYGVVED